MTSTGLAEMPSKQLRPAHDHFEVNFHPQKQVILAAVQQHFPVMYVVTKWGINKMLQPILSL